MNRTELAERIKSLGPWYHKIQLAPDLYTTDFNGDFAPKVLGESAHNLDPFLTQYVAGRSVLDLGSNSGVHSFLAEQYGATQVVGVEARARWLEQAEFLRSVRFQGSKVSFVEASITDYLKSDVKFDIVIFRGILYHLSDPFGVLLRLAEVAQETILIETASSDLIPPTCWLPIIENKDNSLAGLDGLAWLPGGPDALEPILHSMGFDDVQVPFWRHKTRCQNPGIKSPYRGWGRFQVIANKCNYGETVDAQR